MCGRGDQNQACFFWLIYRDVLHLFSVLLKTKPLTSTNLVLLAVCIAVLRKPKYLLC